MNVRILAALIAAISVTVIVTTDDNEKGRHRSVTVRIGGKSIAVPKAALEQADTGDVGNHDGLRGEIPPNVPTADIQAAQEQQEKLAASDQLPIVTPDAAPSQRGCTSQFVQNYSSRRGVRPRLWVLHYTVSPNRPGWGDVNAIVTLFNRSAFQASSHYVIDNEGHCAYIVRESDKSWTEASANPVSISVEVINSGKESTYAAKAGLKKLGLVISDSAKRWQIPLQRGRVSGCSVARSGIIDHHSLGACGGGHFDISPPYSVAAVIAAAKKARSGSPLQRGRRSHRIAHSKLKARCRGKHSVGCDGLRARNQALHKRYGKALA